MRGIGNHLLPVGAQSEPKGNGSESVWAQIGVWVGTGDVVHAESAREIAAWYQSMAGRGLDFASFASTGTIADAFPLAVEAEFELFRDGRVGVKDEPSDIGNTLALAALRAYVEESLEVDDTDPRENGPSLMHEEMMDSREEEVRDLGSVMNRD